MTVATTEIEAQTRAALIDVESYEIFLDLCTGPDTFRSRTEVHFTCGQPGATTFADLRPAAVHQLTFNGEQLDPESSIADGRLELASLAASNSLTVEADFRYAPDAAGLQRFTDPGDGATYVMADAFPHEAPNIYCCFDQPDLRADLILSVSAPAGWECISNGAVIERPAGGTAGPWRFASMSAMKTYDLALCAGPYVTAATTDPATTGVAVTVRCRRSLAGSAGLAKVAEIAATTIGFYEELLGVRCRYDKVDITFPPGLAAPAMQSPAATFVSETLLDRIAKPQDEFVTVVLAHEVAHLWFGCIVEARWWDDLWLAEAMASYLSYTACERVLGIHSPWAEFAMRDQASAYRADSVPSAEPVSSPVATAAAALSRPAAITYNKGASVIRQLAALIGEDAMRTGMRDYLVTYGGSAATYTDLIGCWARASGRDLSDWAAQWLRQPGVNTLRPEVSHDANGRIESFAVVQDPPPGKSAPLRSHRIGIGVYDLADDQLQRREVVGAEIEGARTPVPELAGTSAADAIILNDGDLTFAKTRFDAQSFQALGACHFRVGDPITEAVCWNAAWDMTMTAELSAARFAGLVTGRIKSAEPIPGLAELLTRAVAAANSYALPDERLDLLQQLASAALAGVRLAEPGSTTQHALAVGFAAGAASQEQRTSLRSWLQPGQDDPAWPAGLQLDLELHAKVLQALSAYGLASDDDLARYVAADPVSGDAVRATCRALRPEMTAKESAWSAALAAAGQSQRLARATAEGIWAPGQDELLEPFRERYFTEALPALRGVSQRTALRLARLLYPSTLADQRTVERTDEAIRAADDNDPFLPVLVEQRTLLGQVLAARDAASGLSRSE